MGAVAFQGTGVDTDTGVIASIPIAARTDYYLVNGAFRATVLGNGTLLLSKLSAGHFVAMDGGPFTQVQMLQFWQDLANIGFYK